MLTVLVVDDEIRFAEALQDYLSAARFKVVSVTNREEAVCLVKSRWPDVVLLNRKIYDSAASPEGSEDIDHGTAALRELADLRESKKDLYELKVITVTAHGAGDIELEELYNEYSDAILRKSLADEDYVLRRIEERITRLANYNPDLAINPHGVKFKTGERDLLRRLFSNHSRVDVFPLTPGCSGAGVYYVEAYDGRGDRIRDAFVKLSTQKLKVIREVENYRRYVRDIVPLDKFPRLDEEIGLRRTRRLAGFVMSYMGCDYVEVKRLSRYFHEASSEELLLQAIDDVFKVALGEWHRRARDAGSQTFFERYSGMGLFRQDRLIKAFNEDFGVTESSQNLVHVPAQDWNFYHPRYLLELMSKDTRYSRGEECICHNDLRGDNILVKDNSDFTWLIDFGLTEVRPKLSDFLKLETSIKYEVLGKCPPTMFCTLEKALLRQNSFDDSSVTHLPEAQTNQAVRRAFQVIRRIRKLAGEALGPSHQHFDEYLFGLLFPTIQFLKFRDEDRWRKERALMSATLIAERLGLVEAIT